MSYLVRIVQLGLTLVITPMVLQTAGMTQYGIWAVILQVLAYLGLLEMGMRVSLERRVAFEIGGGNESNYEILISTALFFYLIVGVVFLLLGGSISLGLPRWLNLEKGVALLAVLVALLAVFGGALNYPVQALIGFVRGTQGMPFIESIELFATITTGLVTILLLNLGVGLLSLPLALLPAVILRWLLAYWKVKKNSNILLSTRIYDKNILLELLSFSKWVLIGRLSFIVLFNSDNLFVGYWFQPEKIAIYSLTFLLANNLMGWLLLIGYNLEPGIASVDGRGDHSELVKLYLSFEKIIFSLGAIAAVLVFFLNRAFIELWIGIENFGGRNLNIIFSLVLIYGAFRQSNASFFYAIGKPNLLAKWGVIEAGLKIGLILLLVKPTGLEGIALSTVIAGFVISSTFILPTVISTLRISWRLLLGNLILRPILSICMPMLFLLIFTSSFPNWSWKSLLLAFLLAMFLFMVGFAFFIVDRDWMSAFILRVCKALFFKTDSFRNNSDVTNK